MGLSDCWIGVRADAENAEAAIGRLGAELLGEAQGWFWGRPQQDEDLDAAVSVLAREGQSPAVGGWVADSDCAYLVFASPDGEITARVAINETLPYGEPVEGLPDLWGDHDARGRAFEDLARWSSDHAPRAVAAEALLREMPGLPESAPPEDGPFFADDDPWYDEDGETGWVFAEDGVRLVYHRLGLPSIDESVLAHQPVEQGRASGERDLYIGAPERQAIFVHGGDDPLLRNLESLLGPAVDVAGTDEISDGIVGMAERFPWRDDVVWPEWLDGALGLIRTWLAETGTSQVYIWLAGLAPLSSDAPTMQVWPVTADDTE